MGGYFGQEPGTGEEEGEDEEGGYGLRAAYAPIRNNDMVLHLGASLSNFSPNAGDDHEVRIRVRPELHLTERLLNTGKVKDVDDYSFNGVELAFQKGAFSAQGEYLEATLNRMDGEADVSYSGYYAYVSYFLFGAQRTYHMDSGEFGAIMPQGKKGALEIALRMSHLDLNDLDADVEGGSADNVTLGLNWYANDNVRIMFNYIQSDNDAYADGDGDFLGEDKLDIFALRFQYLF
jgi:phosphate-selective porin OprO/OprP